ncbi:MAG: Gfo/Idh/MocA family oxidoreductase [Planctomycetes bacterium]|nr:Gfo/Idh/MocA family oxidoreductase [Planctomycetota bacterium]
MPGFRVALLGTQFMGRVHSHAFRTVASFFPVDPPEMAVLCGQDAQRTAAQAAKFGWEEASTDWREVIARKDIDLVDVCTPGDSHAEIAIAALKAGKHVICEKPLANTVAQAKQMAAAAKKAGTVTLTAYNYRRAPAVAHAKRMIERGDLGRIYHFRARYLQDWILDPNFPLVWRLRKEVAGSGPHGDLNAHITDMARYLVGEIAEVCGMTKTFIRKRPLPAGEGELGRRGSKKGAAMGEVTVEDASLFLARFENGALGSFEATRFAAGRKNHHTWEINGEKGTLCWDLERLNELQWYSTEDAPTERGFRTILCTEAGHPYAGAWWPAGHMLGYEHTFTHEILDVVTAIAKGTKAQPDFEDGLRTQQVLEAAMRSAETKKWISVPR